MAKCERHSLVFTILENGKTELARCQTCGREWKTITTKKDGKWVKERSVTKE